MNRGFLATLFAAAFSFAGLQAAYSAAPVIGNLPNVNVGDLEDPDGPGGSDSNFFVFTNAFQFSTNVSDADTQDTALAWSFGEYDGVGTSPNSRYQINGVGPVAAGTTAVGNLDTAGGPLTPGANQINSGAVGSAGDYATFRDVIFSPTSGGQGPFPAPGATQAADAALGKQVRLYVSDGDNVTSKTIFVTTTDNTLDEASQSEDVDVIYGEDTVFANWIKSGIDDGPEYALMPTSPDSVDVTSSTNELSTIVRASTSRQRILGWKNTNVGVTPGSDKFVRGKFYIYTSNAAGAPVNQVPGFRIRLENGDAVHSQLNVIPGNTGNTGPAAPNAVGGNNFYTLFGNSADGDAMGVHLRPSGNSSLPSLYRMDFDPIDVPALAGTKLGVTMESYATPDPTNATLSLAECVVATYPAIADDPSKRIVLWDKTGGTEAAQNVVISGGAANYTNDFRPGYRVAVQVGTINSFQVDSTPASELATVTKSGAGVVADTAGGPAADRFCVGLISIGGANNTVAARFQAGKLYKARFFATSNIATWSNNAASERQGYMRFRFQTAAGTWNAYTELLGPKRADLGDPLFTQSAVGVGSQNPDVQIGGVDARPAGHGGGWYTVISGTPLDPDIRPEVAGDINTKFGTLASQPGPGVNSASFKDITLGVDIMKQPRNLIVNDATPPANQITGINDPNRANVTLHRVELYEYDQIDDGGY